MAQQEYLFKLAMLEQEMTKLEQQMQLIEQQILEMQNLKAGLEELEKSNEKEMLANLGKNIFIKTEIKDKNLLVDVGNKTFVKKNVAETLKVIEDQLGKLMGAKEQIIGKMQEFQQQTEQIISEAEKEKK
jgi:prefoldin alpha subunit